MLVAKEAGDGGVIRVQIALESREDVVERGSRVLLGAESRSGGEEAEGNGGKGDGEEVIILWTPICHSSSLPIVHERKG
jgi:hypothetical protein